MDVCPSLIANAQPAKLVQPCQGTLHYPPMDAQPTSMLCEALGKDWLNPKQAQQPPMRLRTISAVSLNLVWPTTWASSLATNWGNSLNQGHQLGHIVTVCPGQDSCQRNSFSVCNHVMLTSWFTPVCRIGPCFFPRLQPLEWMRYPQWLVTNQSGQLLAAWQAVVHEVSAKPLPHSNLLGDANTSYQSRTPSPEVASPRECRSSGRTRRRSAPYDCPQAFCQDSASASAWETEEVAESVSIVHHLQAALPFVSPSFEENLADIDIPGNSFC